MTNAIEAYLEHSVSNEACRVVEVIFYVVINGVISTFGTVTNVVNVIIFVKQGFSDSVNISLCGLAVAELGSLLPLVWRSICFNPLFIYADTGFDSLQVQFFTAGWSHRSFAVTAAWITAFITFERCVCIALPMKVRTIITPRLTFIIIVTIYILGLHSIVVFYCLIELVTVFKIQRNKTLILFSYSVHGAEYEKISTSLSVLSQVSSSFIVLICTVILIVNLVSKSRWRRKATAVVSLRNSDSLSLRDTRVMKMIACISSIFIVCYLPIAVNAVFMITFFPDYSNSGRFQNIYQVGWAVLNMMECFNSTITIVIYYNMSTRFRACFKTVFFGFSKSHCRVFSTEEQVRSCVP